MFKATNYKNEVAASNSKLYLGTFATPANTPRLEILNLNTTTGVMGTKAGTSPYEITEDATTPFACKGSAPCGCSSPLFIYLFQPLLSPTTKKMKALYRRPRQIDNTPQDYTVGVLKLDATTELPTSSQEVVPVISSAALHSSAQAPDGKNSRVWLADDTFVTDVFSQVAGMVGVQPDSWTLGTNGVPTGVSFSGTAAISQVGNQMAVASNSGRVVLLTEKKSCVVGSGVVNQKKGLYLKLAVTYNTTTPGQSSLPPNSTIPVSISGIDLTGATAAAYNVSTDNSRQVTSTNCLSLDNVKKAAGTIPLLENRGDDVAVLVDVNGGLAWKVISPTYTMQFFYNTTCTGTASATITSTINKGGQAAIVVPGYAIAGLGSPTDTTRFKSMQGKTADYVTMASTAASQIPNGSVRKPTQFTIGCGPIIGYQGSAAQLSNSLEAGRLLGCNTANFSAFEPMEATTIQATISSDTTRPELKAFEHSRSWTDFGFPVLSGYAGCEDMIYASFDFDLYHNGNFPSASDNTCAEKWADTWVTKFISSQAAVASDIKYFSLIDEPVWEFPVGLKRAPSQWSRATTEFQNYIALNSGLPATDFGGSDPNDYSSIQMTGYQQTQGTHLDYAQRARRYYWTMDFLQDAMARGAEWLREAWEKIGGAYPVFYNDLSQYDVWFSGSWPSGNSEGDLFSPDWKRTNSVLDGVSEISGALQNDRSVDRYEYQAALLQSSLSLPPPSGVTIPSARPRTIGGIIHGQDLGFHAWGPAYTAMSLIGHGAKMFEWYAFGPYPFFLDDNGWSDTARVYQPIARANDLIGAAELIGSTVFFAGQPAKAGDANGNKVAIVLPTTSNLWNPSISPNLPNNYYYTAEAQGIYLALAHQAIGADFIDQREITATELGRYKVVYVVGPNLPSAVTQILVTWVHDNSGVLALTPGAIVSDEYNQHDATIENIFNGVPTGTQRNDAAARVVAVPAWNARNGRQLNTVSSPVCGADSAVFTANPAGTSVEQNYATGGPPTAATLSKVHGNGKIYFYSYFPGFSYLSSPDRTSMTRLPTNWDTGLRDAVAMPTTYASFVRAVKITLNGQSAQIGGVEPLLLQAGNNGDAVVLLNWTDAPLTNLVVYISNARAFTHSAALALGGALAAGTVFNVNDLKVVIPTLGNVDVLIVK